MARRKKRQATLNQAAAVGRLRLTTTASREKLISRLLAPILCYCPWLLRPMLILLRRWNPRRYREVLLALAAGVQAASECKPKPPGVSRARDG